MNRVPFSLVLLALCALPALGQAKQTDREFDGLKGLVKSVAVEEAQYDLVAGELVERKRVPSRTVTYDAKGNWKRWEDYDEKGRLWRALAFSFMGRDRVALAEDVERPPDTLVLMRPAPRGRRTRFDPRYTYKFTYVYAPDGKRSGESWYFSGGGLYLRYVFAHKGGRKVRTQYDERGRLRDMQESKLDERGNEVEVLLRDTVDDKLGYKYLEFDAQGNWTKRVVTRGFKEFSAVEFARVKPWSVEYRTLTYH